MVLSNLEVAKDLDTPGLREMDRKLPFSLYTLLRIALMIFRVDQKEPRY